MREVAKTMTEKLDVVMSKLAEKQAKVKAINDNLASLGAKAAELEAQAKSLND
jgi:predicted nuclease with TOPRIM domain